MKVTRIRPFCFTDDAGRKYFIVKVETDADIHGLGEVGIPNWGGAIVQALGQLAELVVGQDPFATEALGQQMFRAGFFPADKVYACAISAIDIALWDIKGKATGLPVYKLLGGPVRESVVCYPHVGGATTEELIASCEAHIDAGWQFVRWHLPGEPVLEPREAVPACVEQIAAIREAAPDVGICLDVHTRLDMAHTMDLCRRLEPYGLYFIEDPLRSENPGSYRALARHVHVPIAAGEQWSSKWGFREVIEEELIQYARIDLCIVGGLTEALKVTHWSETHYIDIVPHNPLGPVSAAAGVALCMASTNVGVQEMPRAPGSYATDLFPSQIEWEGGYARCSDVPGLGVELNETLAEERRAPLNTWVPRVQRRDGAFSNW